MDENGVNVLKVHTSVYLHILSISCKKDERVSEKGKLRI